MQEAFFVFITKISLYPTIVFTGLVMFVTLYWVVSLLGMADMDSVDTVETGSDAAVSDLSSTGFFYRPHAEVWSLRCASSHYIELS